MIVSQGHRKGFFMEWRASVEEEKSAKLMDGRLYRVLRSFGENFPIYYEYSDEDGKAIPSYPDFEEAPFSIIGICMKDERRLPQSKKEEKI